MAKSGCNQHTSPTQDLTGQEFGRLVAEEKLPYGRWRCTCKCGKSLIVRTGGLTSGGTKSCGCYSLDSLKKRMTHHGMYGTPTYNSWQMMKQRCLNENAKRFQLYGGRGIVPCMSWIESFESFFRDMGERPRGCTLDRIDGDMGYNCGHCEDCLSRGVTANCRWATLKEQARNKKTVVFLEYHGERKCVAEWAELTGINSNTIVRRIRLGWTAEDTLTKPVRENRPNHLRSRNETSSA